jgi:hypothetical protein
MIRMHGTNDWICGGIKEVNGEDRATVVNALQWPVRDQRLQPTLKFPPYPGLCNDIDRRRAPGRFAELKQAGRC